MNEDWVDECVTVLYDSTVGGLEKQVNELLSMTYGMSVLTVAFDGGSWSAWLVKRTLAKHYPMSGGPL